MLYMSDTLFINCNEQREVTSEDKVPSAYVVSPAAVIPAMEASSSIAVCICCVVLHVPSVAFSSALLVLGAGTGTQIGATGAGVRARARVCVCAFVRACVW